jgi:hypothetical protein
MKESLPPDVRVSELPGGGTCYHLPDRPATVAAQASGCGFLLGGLLLTALAACILPGSVPALLSTPQVGQGVFVLAVCGLMLWGLTCLRTALFRLSGCHRRIEVRAGRLRVVEWLGPLWRSRSRRLDRLRRLEIGPDPTAADNPGRPSTPLALTAACADAPLVLAVGFPHDWLVRLAADLRRHCDVTSADVGAVVRGSPVEVVTLPGPGAALPGRVPPARGRSAEGEQDGVLTVTIGRPNLRYADKGSLIFGFPFLAIGTVMPAYMMASGQVPWWGMLPLLGAFGTVGAVFVVVALRIISTRAVITVDRAAVELTQSDWFFTRRHRWARADVAGIGLGDSNLPHSKGGPAVPELRVRFGNGSHAGLLGGRDKQELEWIATVLNDALRRLPAAERPGPDDELVQPPESRAVLERARDGFRLTIPPLGWRGKVPVMTLVGVLLLAAGTAGAAALAQNWGLLSPWWGIPGAVLSGLVVALGIGLMLEVITYARRRRVLTVSGDLLFLWQTTWWGARERSWAREEIAAIDVGPLPAPGKREFVLPQVRIHPHRGRPHRFLIYHDQDELLWIAALLRQGFKVPAQRGPGAKG